ncbi:MAG: hypothetical protein KJ017_06165 [Alphaproteobacteria bacterium]|nr:hypothetical protein [Alphaproteobacteria bacterium]
MAIDGCSSKGSRCACWVWAAALIWLIGLGAVSPLSAAEVDLYLRAAWGGGAPRCWTGRIQVLDAAGEPLSSVRISEPTPVGLSPDSPGAMRVADATISISPRVARDYDGVDFRLQAPRDATVRIELVPRDEPGSPHQVTIPVSHLIGDFHSSLLDNRGNQLRVRRRPGDQLRVRFDRDSLVFRGGERFDFFVTPHWLGVETEGALSCELTLTDTRSGDKVWDETRDVRIDAQGNGPELGPFSVSMPDRDGVFDLSISMSRRRLPTPFAPVKVIGQRSVQVAVLATQALEPAPSPWNVLAEIVPQTVEVVSLHDNPRSRLWNPLPKIPHWWWFPGSTGGDAKRPLGNGKSSAAPRTGEGYVELAPGGWQAYPLPAGDLLRPHLLELDCPADRPQGLNIRVIEAGTSGTVTPFGPSSGLDISGTDVQPSGRTIRHRLVFWPKSQTPLLLLTNSRPDMPAAFGRIRVLTGPRQLPSSHAVRRDGGRLAAVYYDRPLFWEDFSAADTVDLLSGRSLNDWQTFQEGGLRLVEYLPFAGYNGAMVCVLHDGGTIYPSRLLEPTPRYDNGTFFGTGQDPLRKDALELLFRLFDRHGLTLIPMLRFSTPLPELERLLLPDPASDRAAGVVVNLSDRTSGSSPAGTGSGEGIELVGSDGRPWRDGVGAAQAAGPYYNPLDPRVQRAMRRVVVELVDRYGHHESFGGVSIRLGPDTYAQMPEIAWGLDSQTLARFASANRVSLPLMPASDPRQMPAWMMGDLRDAWATWRAKQLAEFYTAMQSDLTDRVAGARLYLAGADMLNVPSIQADLHPRLPDRLELRQQMQRVGIDPWLYANSQQLVLLKPERVAPTISLEEQAANLQLRQSPEMDQMFAWRDSASSASNPTGELRAVTGSLFYHEPQTLIPASFRDASPYGAEKTSGWFLEQTVPAGDRARKRFVQALASQDSQVVADGGWVAGQTSIDSLTDLLLAYRRLPSARFETVRAASASEETQPVVVRRLTAGQRTYLYLVNHSPWPVQVSVSLDDRRPFTLTGLGERALPDVTRGSRDMTWTVDLRPYDLVAASLSAPDVQVRDWQVVLGRDVLVELRQSVDELRRRIGRLSDPVPLSVLTNPGFEMPMTEMSPGGWEHARGDGITVGTDEGSGRGGQRSLRIQSDGPVVWVRSNPFPTPTTGRLAVFFWLKIDDPERQPRLQLAIEGRLNGEAYYRPARVGAASNSDRSPPPPLTDSWAPYLVRVDNLPPSVTDLRVAIDLMGAGQVSVDDIQVFDLWFDRTERNELLKLTALANLYLGKGAAVDCERLLRGYWAEFLRRNVLPDEVQLAGQTAPSPSVPGAPASASSDPTVPPREPSTSWLQRVVPKPQMPKLFR